MTCKCLVVEARMRNPSGNSSSGVANRAIRFCVQFITQLTLYSTDMCTCTRSAYCTLGHFTNFTTKHAKWPTRCSDDRLEPKNGFLVKFWVNNPCMRMHTNVFLWSKCALGSKKTTILGTFWCRFKIKIV